MDLLKVGDRILTSDQLVPLLSKTNLLSRLIEEVIVDDAIGDVALTPEETQAAEAEFCQRHKITNPQEANAWAQKQYSTPDLIKTSAIREKKLAKFKTTTFAKDLESHFLQRKSRLDRVIYSLIRTSQLGLAQELYFRIHDDGQPFADLAQQYSEGQEAKTGGLIGPVELSVPHPALAGLLSVSKPGQIWPPKRVGEWYIVVRLEKFLPAQMDASTQQRLLDELFQTWMREQVQNSPLQVPGADTIAVEAKSAEPHLTASIPLNRDETAQSQPAAAEPVESDPASPTNGDSTVANTPKPKPPAAPPPPPSPEDPWQ
ncbi:MAG: peptidylprolyl isomerase [Cyanobacteria bacterium P01_D01_bin.71]